MSEISPTLQTERLVLRRWCDADIDVVFAYSVDPAFRHFLRFLPDPCQRRDAEQFVAGQISADPDTHAAWAVTCNDRLIGGVDLRRFRDHRLAELGYSLARSHWRNGYMTEAVRAVIDAAFRDDPELNRIRASADVRNVASWRVMEKAGMRREGVLRQNRIEAGAAIDEAWHGLLRIEWDATIPRAPSAFSESRR